MLSLFVRTILDFDLKQLFSPQSLAWFKRAGLEEEVTRLRQDLLGSAPRLIQALTPIDDQQDEFLADRVENPEFTYSKLIKLNAYPKRFLLQRAVNRAQDLLPKLPPPQQLLVTRYITTIEQQWSLYDAAHALRRSPEEVNKNGQWFNHVCDELYGEFDPELYHKVTVRLLEQIEQIPVVSKPKAALLADEIRAMLPVYQTEVTSELYEPSSETLEFGQRLLSELFGEMLDKCIPRSIDTFTPTGIVDVFNEVFRESGYKPGWPGHWCAKLSRRHTSIATSKIQRIIYVPINREPVTNAKLRGLILHEIFVHAARSVDGGEKALFKRSYRSGLEAEEGLGASMELLEGGDFNRGRLYEQRYLASILARGLPGRLTPLNFRDVFEIIWRHDAIAANADESSDISHSDIEQARGSAFVTVKRSRRGTPGNLEGVAFTKDKVYLSGLINTVARLDETDLANEPHQFTKLFLGKVSPANRLHQAYLEPVANE